jgi:DNA-binding MarR family transcriptional regulator
MVDGLRLLLAEGHGDLSVRQVLLLLRVAELEAPKEGGHSRGLRRSLGESDLDPDPRWVRSIAAWMGCAKSNVTRGADRLGGLGLLVRRDDPADRRSVFLVATAEGRRLARKVVGA